MNINGKKIGAVILAAGKGTRLGCTDCPKVMMEIGGRPIVTYAYQAEQNGTAHATSVGMKALPLDIEYALVMGGDDSAFYTSKTLLNFINKHIESDNVLSLLTAELENVQTLGREVRHEDGRIEVIEKEYLTDEQKNIKEISTGTFCFDRAWFEEIFKSMPKLRKLGEYGLPTAVAMARDNHLPHQFVKMNNPNEWFGVNTPEELEEANNRKFQPKADQPMVGNNQSI